MFLWEMKEQLSYMVEGLPITGWRLDEQPREKMLARGVDSLTDAELVALLLGAGTRHLSAVHLARNLLDEFGGFQHLARTEAREMCKLRGIGTAKACLLAAAFEMGRRKMKQLGGGERLNSPIAIAEYIRPHLIDLPHEEFFVLLLNSNLRLLEKCKVSQGGVNSCTIDPKVIFRRVAFQRAVCMALCHNHPSGNPQPSQADNIITKKLMQGAELMDCQVVDHVIVGLEGYYSFQEAGRLEELRVELMV